MENCNIERLDRPAGAHGGIATLIRTGISYSVLNNPSNMEALIVRLKLSTDGLTVVSVYHRPSHKIPDNPAIEEESSQPHWIYQKADWKGFKNDCKRLLTEDIITDDVTTSCNKVVGAIPQAAEKNVPVCKLFKNPKRKPVPY